MNGAASKPTNRHNRAAAQDSVGRLCQPADLSDGT